jgi:hypothetical protein
MSPLLDFIIATLKPFLKGITVHVDREKKIVIIEEKGDRTELTFDEVADRIEELFNRNGS